MLKNSSKYNIVLIGMPLSGKTIIGKILANKLEYNFYDSDILLDCKNIRLDKNMKNIKTFRAEEEKLFLNQDNFKSPFVLATGGGVVLNNKIMEKLKIRNNIIIYLYNSLEWLNYKNIRTPHIIYKNGVKKVFDKRYMLYEKYFDIKIDIDDLELVDIVGEIYEKIKDFNN